MDPLRRGLNLRPALLAAGMTDRELRALRRSGRLAAVRPGAYVVDAPAGAAPRHRFAARAALVHGLPLWAVPLDRVHATRARRSGARRSRYLHLHAAALEPDEVVEVDGLPVTSPARTLVDLGRSLPFEQALVPVDAALHRHLVNRAGLGAALDRAARRRGNAAARQVLAFARPGAESPGESRSRLAVHRAGLPAPRLQHPLTTPGGRALGRVDFWWEESGVVGEFDGAAKYGRSLRPGQDAGDVVLAEKVREDAIRAAGHGVVRWTWSQLDPFDVTADRIRAALARGRHH